MAVLSGYLLLTIYCIFFFSFIISCKSKDTDEEADMETIGLVMIIEDSTAFSLDEYDRFFSSIDSTSCEGITPVLDYISIIDISPSGISRHSSFNLKTRVPASIYRLAPTSFSAADKIANVFTLVRNEAKTTFAMWGVGVSDSVDISQCTKLRPILHNLDVGYVHSEMPTHSADIPLFFRLSALPNLLRGEHSLFQPPTSPAGMRMGNVPFVRVEMKPDASTFEIYDSEFGEYAQWADSMSMDHLHTQPCLTDFYRAQEYRYAGKTIHSLYWYAKVIARETDECSPDLQYFANLHIAKSQSSTNSEQAIQQLLKCGSIAPKRAEHILVLVDLFTTTTTSNPSMEAAYVFARYAFINHRGRVPVPSSSSSSMPPPPPPPPLVNEGFYNDHIALVYRDLQKRLAATTKTNTEHGVPRRIFDEDDQDKQGGLGGELKEEVEARMKNICGIGVIETLDINTSEKEDGPVGVFKFDYFDAKRGVGDDLEEELVQVKYSATKIKQPNRIDISDRAYVLYHTGLSSNFLECDIGDELVECVNDFENTMTVTRNRAGGDYSIQPYSILNVHNLATGTTQRVESAGLTRMAMCLLKTPQKRSVVLNYPFRSIPKLVIDKERHKLQKTNASRALDYLLIGVEKGGTTTFNRHLQHHPEIHAPPNVRDYDTEYSKFEPQAADGIAHTEHNYFDREYQFIDIESYVQRFDARRFAGEKTPQYICNPVTAWRVHHHFPNIKILVLLRNPSKRLHSYYRMREKYEGEWETKQYPGYGDPIYILETKQWSNSFVHFLANEFDLLKDLWESIQKAEHEGDFDDVWDLYCGKLARGFYALQIEAWREYFSDDQILILKSEDYFKDERTGLNLAMRFFGLSPWESLEKNDSPAEDNNPLPKLKLDKPTERILDEFYRMHNEKLKEIVDISWEV